MRARWDDLHAVLRSYNVRLEPAGSGARVVGPEHGQRVKASDLGLDLRGLEAKLGPFAPQREEERAWERRVGFAQAALRGPSSWAGLHRDFETLGFAVEKTGRGGRVLDFAAISGGKRYTTSKFCTILFAYELDRRLRRAGRSVQSIAFDPGLIPETGLARTAPRPVQWLARTRLMKSLFQSLGVTMGSVDFSGAALARIAVDPAFARASGKYLQSKDGLLREVESSQMSYDEERAVKLWVDSQKLVRLATSEEPAVLATRDASALPR